MKIITHKEQMKFNMMEITQAIKNGYTIVSTDYWFGFPLITLEDNHGNTISQDVKVDKIYHKDDYTSTTKVDFFFGGKLVDKIYTILPWTPFYSEQQIYTESWDEAERIMNLQSNRKVLKSEDISNNELSFLEVPEWVRPLNGFKRITKENLLIVRLYSTWGIHYRIINKTSGHFVTISGDSNKKERAGRYNS